MSHSFEAMECTYCRTRMTEHQGSGGVQYFRCGNCYRWFSSMYSEVLRGDAKMRARPDDDGGEAFDQVKARLEKWLARIDADDPYRVLGASPADSKDELRSRYRALALTRHPDRGGSSEAMAELNDAYARVSARVSVSSARPARTM